MRESGLPKDSVNCHPSAGTPVKPFFTLPTSCEGPVQTKIAIRTWEGGEDSASFLSHDNGGMPVGNTGCNVLDFSPTLEARPTTNVVDAASGLDVDLHIPQNEDPEGLATAHLRDAVVELPGGIVVNPSSANGLGVCTPAEIGLKTDAPADCSDSSKLGTLEVETALLDHVIHGSVYLASQSSFEDSLLAIYIAFNDRESGVVVKLGGTVSADPVTGQLRSVFKEQPQLPFEDLRLHFFGGAGGSLRTPATCGTYSTVSTLTPWSAPEGPTVTTEDPFAIDIGPEGGDCQPVRPFAPSFDGGSVNTVAGADTPFVINLRRKDGSQEFSSLTVSPPPGLVGRLAGVPYCSEAQILVALSRSNPGEGHLEQIDPSCSDRSQVGVVSVAAGAGPSPFHAPGKVYLSGPYKGAPLSLTVISPAVAGPFDLGSVVVRTALYVDSKTAQVTAKSDRIPRILEGIPLDIREIHVSLNRPEFTLNPTNCDPMAVTGQAISVEELGVSLLSRFQVGDCGALAFRPKLSLRLSGGTKRADYQRLRATVTAKPGEANIARAAVTLPHSVFLANEHIRTVCTRVQFAAHNCPKGSIYGKARAVTPLLDYALEGPVYLRSSNNPLPDLVVAFKGPDSQPIEIELAGRTDSKNEGIRNTFDLVPDAPVKKFTLELFGGQKSLIVNSRDLCKGVQKATVRMDAHNGMVLDARPIVKNSCGQSKKHKGTRAR